MFAAFVSSFVMVRGMVQDGEGAVELFGEEPKILASFTKDTSTNYQEGLLELYKKIHEKALPL